MALIRAWLVAAMFALTLVAVSPLVPTASAQNGCQDPSAFRCCGDIQLLFRNPDLQAGSDGFVRASGQLFAQFQAIGADADKIAVFGFSFSPLFAQLEESTVCAQDPWAPSGAYVINYRADTNPADGFFINLQTQLVPDGQYLAAVHGFDDQDTEIARAWTLAIVDNCDGDVGAYCRNEAAEQQRNDGTKPWPIILPFDGELNVAALQDAEGNADEPLENNAGLVLEFAEELSDLKFFVNDVDETHNLTSWSGRAWDNDYLPGYGPYGAGGTIVPECSQQAPPAMDCQHLGESYQYLVRAIEDDDLIRVEATDLNGNTVVKGGHVGAGGGAAVTDDFPVLQISPDVVTHTLGAGQIAVTKFEILNSGGDTGHPIVSAHMPADWDISWSPAHVVAEPGQTYTQELSIEVPLGAVVGTYKVQANFSYMQGPTEKLLNFPITVNVGEGAAYQGNQTGNETTDGKKKSPGLGFVVPVTFVALAAFVRRSRAGPF